MPPSQAELRSEAEPSRRADAQGVDNGVNANAAHVHGDKAFKVAPLRGADDDEGGDSNNANAHAHHDDVLQQGEKATAMTQNRAP